MGFARGLVVIAMFGCSRDPGASSTSSQPAPDGCNRAFAEKLGVRFVRLCPHDLPDVITKPFWIAENPVGCGTGEHETVACPLALSLTAQPHTLGPLEARPLQVVDLSIAHRTCTLRFGGRLPTASELAQVRGALGIIAVTVHATSSPAAYRVEELPEWRTTVPCTSSPSTVEPSCGPARTVTHDGDELWTSLLRCSATPASADGALGVHVGESCPGDGSDIPRCVLATPSLSVGASVFDLRCEAIAPTPPHPAPSSEPLAAFRCVLPADALVGSMQ